MRKTKDQPDIYLGPIPTEDSQGNPIGRNEYKRQIKLRAGSRKSKHMRRYRITLKDEHLLNQAAQDEVMELPKRSAPNYEKRKAKRLEGKRRGFKK